MKHAVQIFIRWLIITIVFLFVYQVTKAQDCCEFTLLRKDTVLRESSISVIEIPPGKHAVLKFENNVSISNLIDNMDIQSINYSGTWTNGNTTATGFKNNTIAWSNVRGNSFSFTFTGTKLEWFSEYKSTHGRAGIQIDGVEQTPINLAKENSGPGIVAEWNWPESQTHTIRIRVYDNKAIVHDGFRVTN